MFGAAWCCRCCLALLARLVCLVCGVFRTRVAAVQRHQSGRTSAEAANHSSCAAADFGVQKESPSAHPIRLPTGGGWRRGGRDALGRGGPCVGLPRNLACLRAVWLGRRLPLITDRPTDGSGGARSVALAPDRRARAPLRPRERWSRRPARAATRASLHSAQAELEVK